MKYLLLLSLFPILLSSGCADKPSVSAISKIDLPYSITDELTATQITGQIVDYDTTAHPGFITLAWQTWYRTNSDREIYFLEPNGAFAFTVHDNVVRDYNLQYNNQYFEFAVIPGSDPYLELTQAGEGFHFSAPHDSLIEDSNYLIEAIATQAYWERSGRIFNYQSDLDSMQLEMLAFEADTRQRFDSLWQAGGYTDPVLYEFVRQFVDHRIRRGLLFSVRSLSKEHERQANYEKFLFPEVGRELPDIPVFNMMNVDRIQNDFVPVEDLLRRRVITIPVEKRSVESFKLSLATIDSLYTGFSRDILRAGTLIRYSASNKPPVNIAQLVAEMAQTTPYPSLRKPLEERLEAINRVVAPMDAYEQSYLNLPEGLDNPVPAILEKHAGKVIVLDFWATWCSPCIREMKNGYPQLIHKYSPEEVAFVFLARRSSATNWRDRISKLQFSADHYLTDDQQAAVTSKLFGIGSIPHHTLFDQQGDLVKAEASRSLSGLEREIDALLEER